jgi:ribulose-phosphate 3-epimerase
MKSKNSIIPAALVTNEQAMTERLDFARRNGGAIHIDVIDGQFCPGNALPVEQWPPLAIDYAEAHLMVEQPFSYLEKIKAKGATRALVHIESKFDLNELVQEARRTDILLGFVINPDTDLEELRPYYSVSSYFQIMGVHPGRIGQVMEETTKLAVTYLRRTSPNHRLTVSVDGGVTASHIGELKGAGADFFVSSAAIYEGEKSWQENYDELMKAAQ